MQGGGRKVLRMAKASIGPSQSDSVREKKPPDNYRPLGGHVRGRPKATRGINTDSGQERHGAKAVGEE